MVYNVQNRALKKLQNNSRDIQNFQISVPLVYSQVDQQE